MDTLDQQILTHLAADARISVANLSRKMGLARSTVQARLERLESNGTIAGYTIKLGAEVAGNRIRATVLLSLEPRAQAPILSRLQAMPEVEIAHTTSGRFDMLLQLAAPTTTALDDILDRIGAIEGVKSSESLIHLSTRIDRAL